MVLDETGRHVNGTDKESCHHYGAAYERIIGPMRVLAESVMEVGVADGSSLLAWAEVFPNARAVGLDIHAASRLGCGQFSMDRIEFHLGDATKREDCERAAAGRTFDFVCEDASHTAGASLLTLLYLWPRVRPGGMYVIEEFYNIGALRGNVRQLWPFAEVVDTVGPSGGCEPLVVLRKPL